MNSTATWESEELEMPALPDEPSQSTTSRNSLATLQELVLRLICEVQSITEVSPLTIGSGLNFYEEVSRFEIDLIRRALLHTGGHQVQAAKLLNLKVTTLNSKIKHYQINPSALGNIYPLVDPKHDEEMRHA
jgi:transcriptional regulator with GAF, ATPase, and Fis domain